MRMRATRPVAGRGGPLSRAVAAGRVCAERPGARPSLESAQPYVIRIHRIPLRFRLRRVTAIGVPNSALSGQADLQRRLRRRHGVDEPLDRPPAFVPEEFFAFQAFAAPRAA